MVGEGEGGIFISPGLPLVLQVVCTSTLRNLLLVLESSALPSMLLYILDKLSEAQNLGWKRLPPVYSLVSCFFPLNVGNASSGMEGSYTEEE